MIANPLEDKASLVESRNGFHRSTKYMSSSDNTLNINQHESSSALRVKDETGN